jgi:hypothetical protein
VTAIVHPLLAFGPFNQVQAEIDYNLMVLRRTRFVVWDCSTMTLLKIRAGLLGMTEAKPMSTEEDQCSVSRAGR